MSMQSKKDTVREFCAAWDSLDVNKISSLMTQDVVYHNMPIEPLKGLEQVMGFIGGFLETTTSCQFKIVTLVADEDRVVTERLDSFGFKKGKDLAGLPVLGIFEFDDSGKICSWREYWDLQDWIARGGPAL